MEDPDGLNLFFQVTTRAPGALWLGLVIGEAGRGKLHPESVNKKLIVQKAGRRWPPVFLAFKKAEGGCGAGVLKAGLSTGK